MGFFQLLGYFILAAITYVIADTFTLFYSLSYVHFVILYLALYYLCYFFAGRIYSAVFGLAVNKHYLLASVVNVLFFWFDMYYFFKMQKILNIFITDKHFERLDRYFDDKHSVLSYSALALCLLCYSSEPVNKWFYEHYIKKNLPVDSNYFPIYKHLTNPDLKIEL